jgi:hypothetical protein
MSRSHEVTRFPAPTPRDHAERRPPASQCPSGRRARRLPHNSRRPGATQVRVLPDRVGRSPVPEDLPRAHGRVPRAPRGGRPRATRPPLRAPPTATRGGDAQALGRQDLRREGCRAGEDPGRGWLPRRLREAARRHLPHQRAQLRDLGVAVRYGLACSSELEFLREASPTPRSTASPTRSRAPTCAPAKYDLGGDDPEKFQPQDGRPEGPAAPVSPRIGSRWRAECKASTMRMWLRAARHERPEVREPRSLLQMVEPRAVRRAPP